MIQITIKPACVAGVRLVSESETEQDVDLAAWRAIRQLVCRIDKKLRRIAQGVADASSTSRVKLSVNTLVRRLHDYQVSL